MSKLSNSSKIVVFLAALTVIFFILKKPQQKVGPPLVNAREIGTFRGQHFLRVETHFHGPYSYDACDDHGLQKDGTPTPWCLRDLRYGLCYNHVDVAFLTDHQSHIADYPYSMLLMHQPGDTPALNASGEVVGNTIHCADGFEVTHAPGLEGPVLALGMERHAGADLPALQDAYGGGTVRQKKILEEKTNALVGIPHTEGHSIEYLRDFKPDFIEVYNVHAQLHPRMRKENLHVSPYAPLVHFLKYIIDPFNRLDADYLFMEFLEFNSDYFQKWNALLADGQHVTGTGGLDSHENVLKYKGSDGERLDSHRRMTRFMSNLDLTEKDDLNSVKDAIRKGRVYVAIEGFGTPMGLDFYGEIEGKSAQKKSSIVEMGDTLTLHAGETSTLHIHTPTVNSQSGPEKPEIEVEVHYIDEKGHESVVLTGAGPELTVENPLPGNYRLQISIIPRHLRLFVAHSGLADEKYLWVISNPIRVVQLP